MSEKSLAELIAQLQSENSDKRLDAVVALGKTGNLAAIPPLGNALAQDEDQVVRRLAIGALKEISRVEAIPHFFQAREDNDKSVRDLAEQALVESLGEVAQEENPHELTHVQVILVQLGQNTVIKLLDQILLFGEEAETRRLAAITLGKWGLVGAVETLARALAEDRVELVRQAAATALGETGEETAVPFLEKAIRKGDTEGVTRNIVAALKQIGKPAAIHVLGAILVKNPDPVLREITANNLWRAEAVGVAIPYLCQAMLEDKNENVRKTAEITLARIENWQAKANEVLKTLQSGNLERAQIDSLVVVRAIRPPDEDLEQQMAFVTRFIDEAISLIESPRMTSLLAALIIAGANGSASLAGERINAYARSHGIDESKLRPLRIEIGGLTALAPILELLRQNEVLEENLKEDFQKPIARLNMNTRKMWQETIRHAQQGFRMRIYMSITTFMIGLILVIASFVRVMIGNLTGEELVGPGISLASGIVTMLLTTFYGPLRQIRQSVNDLGTASAAFIAYIHRVTQISHTFSFYYLKQRISFEEMEKASSLIEKAMNATVHNLNQAESNIRAKTTLLSFSKPDED